MADTPTLLADVIVPDVFNPYFREASTRLNAFFASGVVQTVPDLTLGEGGSQVQMPFWKALGERAQLLDDNDDLEIRKVQTGKDVAVLNARGLVYGGSDLAAALAGDDPMAAIAAGVAENWAAELNFQLIATLKGAFASLAAESPSGNNVHDISLLSGAAAYIDGESFIDATQTLGDMKSRLVAVAMHSAVNAWLAKQGLIETFRDADGVVQYETFMGKRVIVDDAIEPTAGVYDTYLFGPGAIGFAEGEPKVPTETGREPLKGGGQDFLVTRRHYVLHPRGIKWVGTPTKLTPSDQELATYSNWTRVYEPKNIRMALLRHKIG